MGLNKRKKRWPRATMSKRERTQRNHMWDVLRHLDEGRPVACQLKAVYPSLYYVGHDTWNVGNQEHDQIFRVQIKWDGLVWSGEYHFVEDGHWGNERFTSIGSFPTAKEVYERLDALRFMMMQHPCPCMMAKEEKKDGIQTG